MADRTQRTGVVAALAAGTLAAAAAAQDNQNGSGGSGWFFGPPPNVCGTPTGGGTPGPKGSPSTPPPPAAGDTSGVGARRETPSDPAPSTPTEGMPGTPRTRDGLPPPARGGSAGDAPDWRPWWSATRPLLWPERQAATGGNAAWVAEFERAAAATAPARDRWAVAHALAGLADPAGLPIATRLSGDGDDAVAALGMVAFVLAGPARTEALVAFAQRLGDPAERATRRAGAAAALGWLGDRGACAALRAALQGGQPAAVRRAAAEALGRVGDGPDVDRLARLLRDGGAAEEARVGAAAGLGLLARRPAWRAPATAALREALAEADALPRGVRQTAALALGRGVGDGAAAGVLATLAQGDPDAGTRACATLALGFVAHDGAVARRRAADALVARFDAEAGMGRAFPALALGLAGHRGARPRLEAWLVAADEPRARGAAAIALGLLGDPAALPALVALARGAGPAGLRADALEAIALIASPDAAGILRPLARGTPDPVRAAAIYGLGLLAQDEDEGLGRDALADPFALVRAAAALGCAARGGAAARDACLTRARDERDAEVRVACLVAAGLGPAARPIRLLAEAADASPFAASP